MWLLVCGIRIVERGLLQVEPNMKKKQISVSCAATQEAYSVGAHIFIRVEIKNLSGREIEIPAVGVPWHSFYAIEFKVRNSRGFRPRLPEVLPLELPAAHIPAGGSISGEVDLGAYLLDETGKSIASRPGNYVVEATVKTFLGRRGSELYKVSSEPFAVRIRR